MDINKVSDEEKLNICSLYFKGGFALLPILWVVNGVWFYKQAFKRDPFSQQKQIRRYVIWSAIGASIWLAAMVAWIIVFQTHRVEWDEIGDRLSLVYPRGRA